MWDYSLKDNLLSLDKPFEKYSEKAFEYALKNNHEKFVKQGFYKNAVIADPLFASPFNFDFTLPENSPAWDIGFKPLDISDVGPRN